MSFEPHKVYICIFKMNYYSNLVRSLNLLARVIGKQDCNLHKNMRNKTN